ncbi:MAG TPA: hypothetical protein VKS21_04050, partial [Spirochaetota bacterium]|nr:hypothetical protein [Spirochaetota bacterium]
NIDPAAHTDNSFALTYNPGLQNGFKQIEIRAEGFLVQSNVICTATNIVQTGELSIAALTVESDVRNNIIYTADGNPASIKVDKDAEVIIFDILGLRLGKLPAAAINADGWAEWDGKLEGVYVPSGVYILGVKKGKQIIKYEQVVVEKNRR